jgi:hypothetical protein
MANDRDRARRLRSPLLLVLWALLAFEALGGLVIFTARLISGTAPGETLHVVLGIGLTATYALYQWRHWARVRPFRARLDYALGLIAAVFMSLANLSGLWLAVYGWQERAEPAGVRYPALLSAVHNVCSMVLIAFVVSHLGAVLLRGRNPAT